MATKELTPQELKELEKAGLPTADPTMVAQVQGVQGITAPTTDYSQFMANAPREDGTQAYPFNAPVEEKPFAPTGGAGLISQANIPVPADRKPMAPIFGTPEFMNQGRGASQPPQAPAQTPQEMQAQAGADVAANTVMTADPSRGPYAMQAPAQTPVGLDMGLAQQTGGMSPVPQWLADQSPSAFAQTPQAPSNAPMGQEATQKRLAEIFGSDTPITLNQGITGNPDAVMAPDFQGRMRSFDNQAAATQNLSDGQAAYDAASQARSDAAGLSSGGAYRRSDAAVSDADRRAARGEGLSMEQATRLTGGNRDEARAMIERQRQGMDEFAQGSGYASEKERAETAKIKAETADIISQIGNKGTELNLSPAELARDKAAGGTLNKWDDSGRATIQSNIGALEEVIGGLESGQIKTRGFVDALPFGGDWARAIVNPTGQDAKDRVQGVIFQTLRETLGAQFTEKEGQRLVEASYNVKLSPEQNAERLRDYTDGLKRAAEARESQMRYLKENKTLSGYEGPTPSDVMSRVGASGVNGSPIKGDVDYKSDVQSKASELMSGQ